VNRCTESGHDR